MVCILSDSVDVQRRGQQHGERLIGLWPAVCDDAINVNCCAPNHNTYCFCQYAYYKIGFVVNSIFLFYNFIKAWKMDPGFVIVSQDQRYRVSYLSEEFLFVAASVSIQATENSFYQSDNILFRLTVLFLLFIHLGVLIPSIYPSISLFSLSIHLTV